MLEAGICRCGCSVEDCTAGLGSSAAGVTSICPAEQNRDQALATQGYWMLQGRLGAHLVATARMRAGSSYTSLAQQLRRCASPSATLQLLTSCLCSGLALLPAVASPLTLQPPMGCEGSWLPCWLAVSSTLVVVAPLAVHPLSLWQRAVLLPLSWSLLALLPLLAVLALKGNAAASYGNENRGSARLITDTGVPGASGAACQNAPARRRVSQDVLRLGKLAWLL